MKKATVIILAGLLALFVFGLLAIRSGPGSHELSQPQFVAMLQSNRLTRVRLFYPPEPGQVDGVPVMLNEVRGTFYQTDAASQGPVAQGIPKESLFIAQVHLTPELEKTLIARTNVVVVIQHPLVQKIGKLFRRSK